jgi:hypothetical protein
MRQITIKAPRGTAPQIHVLGLLLNIVAIVLAALGTYAAIRVKGKSLNCFDLKSEKA